MIGRLLLLVPGLITLAFAAFVAYQALEFRSGAERARGVVVRDMRGVGETHHPRVEFTTPDGRKHQFTGVTSPLPFEEGAPVAVLYDGAIPERASIDTFGQQWFRVLVLTGLGGLLTLAAGVPLYRRIRRQRRNEWLKQYGRAIDADFNGIKERRSYMVNGRYPHRIVAQWRDPSNGQTHRFESVDLWFDPSEQARPKTITVMLDPSDETRYWMDLSFLTGYVDN